MRNVDFLPETYRQERRRYRQRLRQLSLAAAGLCLLAFWLGVDEVRVRRARGHVEYLQRQNDIVQAGLDQMAKLQSEQTVLLDKYRLLNELQSPISSVESLLRIARLLPDHVAVRRVQIVCGTAAGSAGMDGTKAVAAVTGGERQAAAPAGPRVALCGIAMSQVDIAVLVGQLSGCREFANVRLDYSKAAEVASRQVQEFRVTFDVPGQTAGEQAAGGA